MGRLILKTDIKDHNIKWYFEDAIFSSEWAYPWPSASFPYSVFMNKDSVGPEDRVRIRRWIENNLQETVITEDIDHSYTRYYDGAPHTWQNSFQVMNTWYGFYFENAESATAFSLVFSELIKPKTKYHPDHPEHKEWVELTPYQRISNNGNY